MSGPSFYGGASVLAPKSKFKNTNLNTMMTSKPTRLRKTISNGLYVAEVDKNRVMKLGVTGITALPTPVNTPSLRRENKSNYQSNTISLVPQTDGSGKVWGSSSDQSQTKLETTVEVVPTPAQTTSTRQSAWATTKPAPAEMEAPIEAESAPKALTMSSWADAESDEEEEEEEPSEAVPYPAVLTNLSPRQNSMTLPYQSQGSSGGGWSRGQDARGQEFRGQESRTQDARWDNRGDFRDRQQSPRGGSYSQDARGGSRENSFQSAPYGRDMSQQQQQPMQGDGRVLFDSRKPAGLNNDIPMNKEIDEKLAEQHALETARKEREDLERRRKLQMQQLHQQQQPPQQLQSQQQQQNRFSRNEDVQSSRSSTVLPTSKADEAVRWERAKPPVAAPPVNEDPRRRGVFDTRSTQQQTQYHSNSYHQQQQHQQQQQQQSYHSNQANSSNEQQQQFKPQSQQPQQYSSKSPQFQQQQQSLPMATQPQSSINRPPPPPPAPYQTQPSPQTQTDASRQAPQSLPLHPTPQQQQSSEVSFKSYKSLFPNSAPPPAPEQQQLTDASSSPVAQDRGNEPTQILRNPSGEGRRMLYDPKKNLLVESEPPITKTIEKKVSLKVGVRVPMKMSAKEDKREDPWKRRQSPGVDEEITVEAMREPRKKHAAQSEPPPVKEEDPEVLRLSMARALEKQVRGAHTKGQLYELTENGDIRQVMSEEEAIEMEQRAVQEAERKREVEQRKEQRRVDKEKKTAKDSEGWRAKSSPETEVKHSKPATLPDPEPPALVVPKISRPAWQAPGQTLVDLGVKSSADKVIAKPDKPFVAATTPSTVTGKIDKTKKSNVKSKLKLEKKRPSKDAKLARGFDTKDTFVPVLEDLDTTNLDIRDQGPKLRNPDSYPTFVPGTGLSQSSGDIDWEFEKFGISSYDLGGLGIDNKNKEWRDSDPSYSRWSPAVATGFLSISNDDMQETDAVLSSVAFAIGADINDEPDAAEVPSVASNRKFEHNGGRVGKGPRPAPRKRGEKGPPRTPIINTENGVPHTESNPHSVEELFNNQFDTTGGGRGFPRGGRGPRGSARGESSRGGRGRGRGRGSIPDSRLKDATSSLDT